MLVSSGQDKIDEFQAPASRLKKYGNEDSVAQGKRGLMSSKVLRTTALLAMGGVVLSALLFIVRPLLERASSQNQSPPSKIDVVWRKKYPAGTLCYRLIARSAEDGSLFIAGDVEDGNQFETRIWKIGPDGNLLLQTQIPFGDTPGWLKSLIVLESKIVLLVQANEGSNLLVYDHMLQPVSSVMMKPSDTIQDAVADSKDSLINN